jgi:hypothetical protein
MQIVNGGQTTASLFHTMRKHKADLSDVFVQMKLTVIGDEEKKNEILDEYEEILAQNDEINDRMNDLAGGDLTEDEELMAELNAMMESELEQPTSMQQPTSVFNLPQVPVSQVNQIPAKPSRVSTHSSADEEALRALALDMS